jgi:hypothetical protein
VEQEKIKAAIIAATPIPMRMTLTDPVEFQFETADRGLVHRYSHNLIFISFFVLDVDHMLDTSFFPVRSSV